MNNFMAALIFLLFEFSITTGWGDRVITLFILPRWIGYLILARGYKPPLLPAGQRWKRTFFYVMFILELFKCIYGLFLYRSDSAVFIRICAVVSVIAMLYAIKSVADTVKTIEAKHSVDVNADALLRASYWLIAASVLTFIPTKIYILFFAVFVVLGIRYCLRFFRTKNALFDLLPPDEKGSYL